jgi:phage terminase large subunit
MSVQTTRSHSIEFSSIQQQFMRYVGKQALLNGGFGGGKTRTGNEKGYMLGMKYPGNRGLIVRSKSSDVASSTVRQSLLEEVIPDSHIPDDPSEGHNQSRRVIRHYTGTTDKFGQPVMSEIHYHGLDSTGSNSKDGLPRKISGMQFGWIFVDEATELSKQDWVQLLGRLRYDGKTQAGQKYTVPFRQIFGATNPAGPSHWLYDHFYSSDAKQNSDKETFHIKAEDNPGVPDDYVDQLKNNYSGVYYERYVLGNWVGTADAIYDEFDRRKFVVDIQDLKQINSGWGVSENPGITHLSPPESWDVYRSIDFGYPSPMVVQWWAVSPEQDNDERRYVLFREFYQSNTLVEEAAEEVKTYSEDLRVEQTFADPAQASDRETLSRNGISSQKAEKDVWNGIQEVKGLMNTSDEYGPMLMFAENTLIHEPDGELDGNDKPFRTVDEIPSYEWKNSESDIPRKVMDHGMDSMRYMVYTMKSRGGSAAGVEMVKELEGMFNEGDGF